MGDVWRGTDVVLGRVVAVKVLKPAMLVDPEFSARFYGEARMMAAFRGVPTPSSWWGTTRPTVPRATWRRPSTYWPTGTRRPPSRSPPCATPQLTHVPVVVVRPDQRHV